MMISSGINLVMTVIGFGVSTLFIVFVCTRLICARIQLSASRQSAYVASRADLSVMERGLRGIESVTVASFPTKKYTEDLFSFPEDAQCAVCLSEYNLEDVLRILPNCGHSFHASCIDLWLQQHSTCPVCRISLRDIWDKSLALQPLFISALRPCHGTDPQSLESHPHSLGVECETTAPEGFPGMDRDILPSKDLGCKHFVESHANSQLTQTSSSMIPKNPQ